MLKARIAYNKNRRFIELENQASPTAPSIGGRKPS